MRVNKDELGGWQEQVITQSQSSRRGFLANRGEESDLGVRVRVRVVWGVILGALALVVARVFYLQFFESNQQLLLSENNHIEQKVLTAERGKIVDKDGRVLAMSELYQDKWIRKYPLGIKASVIVGYMSQVKPDELGCFEGLCYLLGSQIGRAGVEQIAEPSLRGRDGGVIEEVDAKGQEVRERGRNESEGGDEVKLTIDARLQEIMYQAMDEARVRDEKVRGAAVAMDMQGQVLGLVSYPSYDPEHIADYLNDPGEHYFLNRAIAGVYPPGSVFKIVTSYAGLKSGVIDKDTEIEDTGEIRVGEYRYGTWNYDQAGRKEGNLNLVRALARSNDIYFYRVGEMAGVKNLVKEAKEMGFGQKSGIELAGESAGLLPDPLWKERKTGEAWFLGNTYHMSIGQGDLLVTPIQVARMTAAAVSGRLCSSHLIAKTESECRDMGLKTEDIETVKEGMKEVCSSGGTAYPLFGFEPYLLCKTGTAQHAGQVGEDDLPHAWITVVYPGENPEMVLTILVEAGGEGSEVAAPIAKQILTNWKNLGNN